MSLINPETTVKASEDFLSLVVNAHVIAAAMNLMPEKTFETPKKFHC